MAPRLVRQTHECSLGRLAGRVACDDDAVVPRRGVEFRHDGNSSRCWSLRTPENCWYGFRYFTPCEERPWRPKTRGGLRIGPSDHRFPHAEQICGGQRATARYGLGRIDEWFIYGLVGHPWLAVARVVAEG